MNRKNLNVGCYVLASIITLGLLSGCSDLQDELPATPQGTSKIHSSGWKSASSQDFHGTFLKNKNWSLDDCTPCHSKTFKGGVSNVSCYGCHSSYPHTIFSETASPYPRGHDGFLMSRGYPLADCKSCHGANYTGGTRVNVTCQKSGCHVDRNGTQKSPEACNTCHGDFRAPANDQISYSPPKGVRGDTASSYRGIGAHQIHLKGGTIADAVACTECHSVPSTLFESGHVDTDLPAEVVFGGPLGKLPSATIPSPVYNNQNLSCGNSYCHGNWRVRRSTSPYQFAYTDSVMVGANKSALWTGGPSEAACGTCHGLPPPGHVSATLTTCVNCHAGVVDGAGKISDKSKHINGKINAFGAERSF